MAAISASVPKSNDTVRDHRLSGFVTISGDRHSFWAGYAAPKLPPAAFNPVGLSFITGSISAPGLAEAAEYYKDFPLLPLFVRKMPGAAPSCARPLPTAVRCVTAYRIGPGSGSPAPRQSWSSGCLKGMRSCQFDLAQSVTYGRERDALLPMRCIATSDCQVT